MTTKNKDLAIVVIAALVCRLGLTVLLHFNTHIGDSPKYIAIAQSILAGQPDFVLNNGLFISAPVYPLYLAAFKLLFGPGYVIASVLLQILLTSVAGIFVYGLAIALFNRRFVALIAGLLYAVLPTQLYFMMKVAQEPLFMAFFIPAIYYLVRTIKQGMPRHLVISACLYSLAFLTKSLIGPYSLLLALALFLAPTLSWKKRILYPVLYGVICYVFTIPYGLYNLTTHGTYTFSTTGPGCVVYFGNTEMQYQFMIKTPPAGTEAYARMHGMDFSYVNGSSFDSLMAKSFDEREGLFYAEAARWIQKNPKKWIHLKLESAKLFLMPSVSIKHYPFSIWLVSFVALAPVYVLAYLGFGVSLKRDFRTHFWMLGLVLFLFSFSVVCGPNARYRVAILEPFYLVYTGYALEGVLRRFKVRALKWKA